MKEKIIMFVGAVLMFIAAFTLPPVMGVCRIWWYQPDEPEGLEEFANTMKN